MRKLNKPIITALDANVCIKHALSLGMMGGRALRDYDCIPIRGFVNGCLSENIHVGCFPTEKKHSYSNLTKAVNNLGDQRRVKSYCRLKLAQIAWKNLDNLFEMIDDFVERFDAQSVANAKSFFERNKRDLTQFLGPESTKDPIPEKHDLEFLVSSHNLDSGTTHIVSGDAHFVGYSDLIPTVYKVEVIPLIGLRQTVEGWKWPLPSN